MHARAGAGGRLGIRTRLYRRPGSRPALRHTSSGVYASTTALSTLPSRSKRKAACGGRSSSDSSAWLGGSDAWRPSSSTSTLAEPVKARLTLEADQVHSCGRGEGQGGQGKA